MGLDTELHGFRALGLTVRGFGVCDLGLEFEECSQSQGFVRVVVRCRKNITMLL